MSKPEMIKGGSMTNEKLAFNLTIKSLKDYAKKCTKDKNSKMMNPIEGTYLMSNSLAIALLYRAENHLKDCKDVIIEAVEDAYKTIKKT
jgi:dihydroxyacetone kinase-like predicted kinase